MNMESERSSKSSASGRSLRSLCLASFRKKAIDRNQSLGLTPGALVEADRQLIVDLIAKASAKQQENTDTSKPSGSIGLDPLLCIGLLSAIAIVVQYLNRENIVPSVCISAFATVVAFSSVRNRTKRLREIQTEADRMLQSRADHSVNRSISGTDEQPVIANLLDQLKLCILEQEESTRLLVDFNECGLLTVDSEGTILEANLTFCDLVGMVPEKIASRSFLQFVIPQDVDDVESKIRRKENFSAEVGLATAALDCQLAFEWSHSLQLYYASVVDITARKNVQRLRREFQSLISHDLRAPLSSLKLTIEHTLRQEQFSEKSMAMLSVAKRSTQRLMDLVEQLLTLYSAEEGTLKVQLQITCASGIVADAVSEVQPLLEQQGIVLKNLADDEPFVLADHGRCVQILTNFLSNAAKYAPKGSTVTVNHQRECDRVRIAVSDEGPGIDEHVVQHLFDRFGSNR
ncbi:MAG: PAS domain-containing sensor histidine kinase, partial [Cyanobacteria bacterium]|nr:PAS domain-containing sensor histidine kinase [Cyanobacteriota bacterium]